MEVGRERILSTERVGRRRPERPRAAEPGAERAEQARHRAKLEALPNRPNWRGHLRFLIVQPVTASERGLRVDRHEL